MCRMPIHPPLDDQNFLDDPEESQHVRRGKKKRSEKKTSKTAIGNNASTSTAAIDLDTTCSANLLPDDNLLVSLSPPPIDPSACSTDTTLTKSLLSLHLTAPTISPALDKDDSVSFDENDFLITDLQSESGDDDDEENLNKLTENVHIHPIASSDPNIVKETKHRLLGYFLSVDPIYNRIICLFCHSLVPFHRTYSHAHRHAEGKNLHLPLERQIPSQQVLEELLIRLNAHKPVDLGTSPIPPFEGIPVIVGYKCKHSHCSERNNIFSQKKIIYRHFNQHHSTYAIDDRPIEEVLCQALSVYKQERVYHQVTYMPQTNVDALKQILNYNSAIGLGKLSTGYHPANNSHARHIIFAYTNWDLMLDGNDIRHLRRTATPPNEETEKHFCRLLELVKNYYSGVAKELPELDVLTRRLVHSSNPQYVLLLT